MALTNILLIVAVVLAALLLVAIARRWPWIALFYLRLYRAQRQAAQFYATCPWVTKNVVYDASTSSRLDVFRPESGSNHPVIFYVYGGSWISGNKELYAPAALRLVPEGFVLVIPDYTLYPGAGNPRQTEEVAAALAWTLDHVAAYGGDPRRVVVVAQSAGGQISGLILSEPRWLAVHGHSISEVRGFLGISGAYDVAAIYDFHKANRRAREAMAGVMQGPENMPAASPLTHVGPSFPPTRLVHGDADLIVPLSVSQAFAARLRSAGVPCELLVYHGGGHADILFRALVERPPRLLNDIVTFARAQTQSEPTAPSPAPRLGAEWSAQNASAD